MTAALQLCEIFTACCNASCGRSDEGQKYQHANRYYRNTLQDYFTCAKALTLNYSVTHWKYVTVPASKCICFGSKIILTMEPWMFLLCRWQEVFFKFPEYLDSFEIPSNQFSYCLWLLQSPALCTRAYLFLCIVSGIKSIPRTSKGVNAGHKIGTAKCCEIVKVVDFTSHWVAGITGNIH